ncbi:hypothetical protein GVN21_07365 [Caulobacter sp. SLTY]|uniref:hypothetical protein n=1 Tax=Caulobacter sp. SLTY TaxID=2683262 RepID=UPI001412D099|nr:hypothetical protein [Caulobacter sp. SLTY]NBB15172.1 hypothetical protein [Caulobacter sp. SLTY]
MKAVWFAVALLAATPALAQAPPTDKDRQALLQRWGRAATEDAERLAERNRPRRPELLNAVKAANPGQEAKVVPIVRTAELCVAEGSVYQTRLDALEVAAGMTDPEILALTEFYEAVRAQDAGAPTDKEALAVLAAKAPLDKLGEGLTAIRKRGLSEHAKTHARGCLETMNNALEREGLNQP